MSVKRYDLVGEYYLSMAETADGDYVSYSDYAELQATADRFAEIMADKDRQLIAVARQRAELLAAAVAVVERWDTPLWKEVEHTGVTIARLRDSIAKARGKK